MLGRNSKSPLGGVLRAAERNPMEEAKEAAMSANELPEGVTADDLRSAVKPTSQSTQQLTTYVRCIAVRRIY
jgi:hypothetical protein